MLYITVICYILYIIKFQAIGDMILNTEIN